MIRLCEYTEYGTANENSIKDHFESKPYAGMDKIITYLKTQGKSTMVRMERAKDRLTGTPIFGMYNLELLSDGQYSWWSDLVYYVEKYNLRLPTKFEEYVLSRL